MPAPLPWFPFYIDWWETDERIDSLSLEEQGALLCLLRWQWREGSISASPAVVAGKLCVRSAKGQLSPGRRSTIAKRLIKLFFVPCGEGPGRLVNTKLAEVFAHQVSKSEKAAHVAREAAARRRAVAERMRSDRSANGGRARREVEVVEVRSEIQKSLKSSAHAGNETNGNGPALVDA